MSAPDVLRPLFPRLATVDGFRGKLDARRIRREVELITGLPNSIVAAVFRGERAERHEADAIRAAIAQLQKEPADV